MDLHFQGGGISWKGRERKSDDIHTGNFNYTLFVAEFGQLIPRLPSLCGRRSREARCSRAAVSHDR